MSEEHEVDITIDDRLFAGVWANHLRFGAGLDEFTLDFVWVDQRELRGVVVARVALSPRLMRRLLDHGEMTWHTWSERNLPPEVRGDD